MKINYNNSKTNYNIWLIQIGEPIPLKPGGHIGRMTMLTEKLTERGNIVTRWGSNFDHITKRMHHDRDMSLKLSSKLTVRFIKGIGYKKNISVKRYMDQFIIAKKFFKQAKKLEKPDVILVATPPHNIAYYAVKFAHKYNIPIIVDVRDQWPDIFIERVPKIIRGIFKIALFYEFYQMRYALRHATSITSMMAELLNWGLVCAKRKKIESDRVFYIGTKEKLPVEITNNKMLNSIIAEAVTKFVVTFVGTFNNFYNPSIIIEVAKMFENEKEKGIHFVLAGDGNLFDEIRRSSEKCSNVVLTGWLNQIELSALLSHSKIGVVPLAEKRPCFPNKVFTYISHGLPIIASTPGEFSEIISKHEIGLYYTPGDAQGLFDTIQTLYKDNNLYLRMRNNMKIVFDSLFNAEKIYNDFSTHVETVSKIVPEGNQ